jgi:hypothetical protein
MKLGYACLPQRWSVSEGKFVERWPATYLPRPLAQFRITQHVRDVQVLEGAKGPILWGVVILFHLLLAGIVMGLLLPSLNAIVNSLYLTVLRAAWGRWPVNRASCTGIFIDRQESAAKLCGCSTPPLERLKELWDEYL